MNSATINFDHWPDKALFPNQAGNTLHWSQRSELRRIAKEEAYWLARKVLAGPCENYPFEKANILIRVTAKDRRKRDLDGFLSAIKPFLDGIVEAGVLEDDNYFCVSEITIVFNANIREDTVTITIQEGM